MAMRKAGVEAAQKAGDRKASASSGGLQPTKSSETPGNEASLPVPSETKLAKSMEEPHQITEITAAKAPAKLAESGASRTSVDKIAEQDTKRALNAQTTPKSDPVREMALVNNSGISSDAVTTDGAGRENSATNDTKTKVKSPLSDADAAISSTDLPDPIHQGPIGSTTTHRGSSVSSASKEDIQEVERQNAIPEEEEEDDDEDEDSEEVESNTKEQNDGPSVEATETATSPTKPNASATTGSAHGDADAGKAASPDQGASEKGLHGAEGGGNKEKQEAAAKATDIEAEEKIPKSEA
jgi:hypothetical protein